MKKSLFLICAVSALLLQAVLWAADSDTNKGSISDAVDQAVLPQTDEAAKKIDAIVKETQDIIKKKQEHVEEVKKEAARVIEEKKEIQEEAKLKEEQAVVARQEAEASKQEAELNKSQETAQKAKQLEREAQELQKESGLYAQKASVAESKAQLALETIASKQAGLDSMRKALDGLQKEKTGKRPLLQKLASAGGIVLVALLSFFIIRFGLKAIGDLIDNKNIRRRNLALRARTLLSIFNWLATIVIIIAALYMILENFGFSVAPLLASAGIIGLAFGFGGQYLIRDIISGFFILMENQYSINDVIKIGEYGGLVEDMNLRITILRDLEGRAIFIPNGEIKTVVNFTKDYAQALFDIGVAYKENVDQVIDVIKQVGKELKEDSYFGRMILNDLEMFGVDKFGDSAVIIKFRIKTLPIKQWDVSREFRRRLKNRFDELGIEIPFPHRTLYWGKGESAKASDEGSA